MRFLLQKDRAFFCLIHENLFLQRVTRKKATPTMQKRQKRSDRTATAWKKNRLRFFSFRDLSADGSATRTASLSWDFSDATAQTSALRLSRRLSMQRKLSSGLTLTASTLLTRAS